MSVGFEYEIIANYLQTAMTADQFDSFYFTENSYWPLYKLLCMHTAVIKF